MFNVPTSVVTTNMNPFVLVTSPRDFSFSPRDLALPPIVRDSAEPSHEDLGKSKK